jgi:hypothetical protein
MQYSTERRDILQLPHCKEYWERSKEERLNNVDFIGIYQKNRFRGES